MLDDLRARLRGFRRVEPIAGSGWALGTDPDYLADLIRYWAEDYDWRVHERRIRSLRGSAPPRRGRSMSAPPIRTRPALVLLHGWPDSVLRYERVLPLLGDVHVVVPALPGYPFAAPVEQGGICRRPRWRTSSPARWRGWDTTGTSSPPATSAAAWTMALASAHADRVAALHLTDVPTVHLLTADRDTLTADERDYRNRVEHWRLTEGAYLLEQATRPHTLAAALGDSPAGLAAWIVEKLRGWSDCDGDVESVFPRDELLTWVTAYWVTGTIGTSFGPYARPSPPVSRVAVPTVITQFAHDTVLASRGVAERVFDLRAWQEETAGGHFAAWERPEAFVRGVRAALVLAAE